MELAHQKVPATIIALNDLFRGVDPASVGRILEIGLARGGGLALWEAAFSQAEIVGVDRHIAHLSRNFIDHKAESNRIVVHEMTMHDLRILSFGLFDLVVDDANHNFDLILANFSLLWPSVTPGGRYIVDDWRTDAGQPEKLAGILARKLIGDYWPSEAAPPEAPARIALYRGLLSIEKCP